MMFQNGPSNVFEMDGFFKYARSMDSHLDLIQRFMIFMSILLILITALLVIQVSSKLYKMHTTSLRERYVLNAANCIQGGQGKAVPTPAV